MKILNRAERYVRYSVTSRRLRCHTSAAAICGLLSVLFGTGECGDAVPPIDTTSGPVVGLPAEARSIAAFLEIPYAEPPVGKLRFLPPVPVKRSNEVIQATHFGAVSAQRS